MRILLSLLLLTAFMAFLTVQAQTAGTSPSPAARTSTSTPEGKFIANYASLGTDDERDQQAADTEKEREQQEAAAAKERRQHAAVAAKQHAEQEETAAQLREKEEFVGIWGRIPPQSGFALQTDSRTKITGKIQISMDQRKELHASGTFTIVGSGCKLSGEIEGCRFQLERFEREIHLRGALYLIGHFKGLRRNWYSEENYTYESGELRLWFLSADELAVETTNKNTFCAISKM